MKAILSILCGLTIGCATKPDTLSEKEIQRIMDPYRDDGLARALMDLNP